MGFYTYYHLLPTRRILSPCLSNSEVVGQITPAEFEMKIFAAAYPAVYQTLYEAKSITCSVTGTMFDTVPSPCAVMLDVRMLYDRQ